VHRPIAETALVPDPFGQFRRWLDDAVLARLNEPTAFALATADAGAVPSVRMVLLKSFDTRGFVFATNYESRKGADLEANPRAAICFHWEPLGRQVRIAGAVERTSAADSDVIHESRPRGARLAAWASPQSRPIADRAWLEERVRQLAGLHPGPVPRPPFWGGYRLHPDRFEFWQGGAHRLHDRFVYVLRQAGGWRIERLAP